MNEPDHYPIATFADTVRAVIASSGFVIFKPAADGSLVLMFCGDTLFPPMEVANDD